MQHQVIGDESEEEENHRQCYKHVHIICFMHMHRLHELLRQHELAIHLITGHPRPPIAKQRQRGTLQGVLQERHVEQPVHKLMGVVQVDKESGKDQEGTDEKWSKDSAILKVDHFLSVTE